MLSLTGYLYGCISFVFFILLVVIFALIENYKHNLIKNGYRSKKDYLKDGDTYFNLIKDDLDVLCLGIALIFVPIVNIVISLIGIGVILLFMFLYIVNLKTIKGEYNQVCKCSKCGIYTRYAYNKLYNKENNLPYENKYCLVCQGEDTLSIVHDRKLENFPKIKNKALPIFLLEYTKERKSFKQALYEYINSYKEKHEKKKKKLSPNQLFELEQENILKKYQKK